MQHETSYDVIKIHLYIHNTRLCRDSAHRTDCQYTAVIKYYFIQYTHYTSRDLSAIIDIDDFIPDKKVERYHKRHIIFDLIFNIYITMTVYARFFF